MRLRQLFVFSFLNIRLVKFFNLIMKELSELEDGYGLEEHHF